MATRGGEGRNDDGCSHVKVAGKRQGQPDATSPPVLCGASTASLSAQFPLNRLAVVRAGVIPIPISTALSDVPLKMLSYCSIFRRVE